jgi:hypothetical protein
MKEKKGTPVETREVPMFRRDYDDYEVGEPMWQEVMTHNIVVSLLKGEPLNSAEMSFLELQNEHLKREKKRREQEAEMQQERTDHMMDLANKDELDRQAEDAEIESYEKE